MKNKNVTIRLKKSYFGYPVGQECIIEDETTSYYCVKVKASKHKILVAKIDVEFSEEPIPKKKKTSKQITDNPNLLDLICGSND